MMWKVYIYLALIALDQMDKNKTNKKTLFSADI